MKILYVSILTSNRLINLLHQNSGKNPGFAALKFHRLLACGFVRNNVEFQTIISQISAQQYKDFEINKIASNLKVGGQNNEEKMPRRYDWRVT